MEETAPSIEREGSDTMTYKYRLEELSAQTFATLDAESVGTLVTLFTAHPDWENVWRYDEFGQRIVAVDPPFALCAETEGVKNHDIGAIKAWLGTVPKEKKTKTVDEDGNESWKTVTVGRKATTEVVTEAITLAARAKPFHPVRAYLDGLPQPSLAEAHATLDAVAALLGGSDPMEWVKRTLVAAIRRVREPGYKHDYILVLIGETQGQGKSTLVSTLFSPWFQDNLPDLATKAAANALRGFWGIELAELEKILRADDATVKAFLSRTEDVFDQKYERDTSRYPRQCVFVGTSNMPDCLRDTTGNRRYWPLRVEKQIDLAWLARNRDAIWAAAGVAAASEFRTWMTVDEDTRANDIRAEFTDVDPWHRMIADYCVGKATVTIEEIWESIAAVGKGHSWQRPGDVINLDKGKRNRIGGTLRLLKCRRTHGAWKTPDELRLRLPASNDAARNGFGDASGASYGLVARDASLAKVGKA